MPEHQTIEWKESWHDEFLEWICGYANAYDDFYIASREEAERQIAVADEFIQQIEKYCMERIK